MFRWLVNRASWQKGEAMKYMPKQSGYVPLTQAQLRIIHDLDNMDRDVTSIEASFLESIISKLDKLGESDAEFSPKQREWIDKLGAKYL